MNNLGDYVMSCEMNLGQPNAFVTFNMRWIDFYLTRTTYLDAKSDSMVASTLARGTGGSQVFRTWAALA